MADPVGLALQITGQLLFVETTNESRLAVAKQSGTSRVAFSAVGDNCPLCTALDGKVMLADSAEAALYTPPLHINCDCILTGVGDDEQGAIDWLTPADMQALAPLVEQHGGLVERPGQELTHRALKIPARPDGRDFTFRRAKDPVTGEVRSEIVWHRPRYQVEGLFDTTVQSGVETTGKQWTTLNAKTLDQATTTSELEAWAQSRWPHMTVDLTGGEVETLRETLAQLDRLGQDYREVEALIPSLRVLPAEEFGTMGQPMAFAATGPDNAIKLNGLNYGDRKWFDQACVLDPSPVEPVQRHPREAVISHEFGEVYHRWLQRARPDLASAADAFTLAHQPAVGLGRNAKASPDEGFADAFMVMHVADRQAWPPYVDGLRQTLRYELRRDF